VDDDVKAEEREEQAGEEALAGHEPEGPAGQADQEKPVAEEVQPQSTEMAEAAASSPASDEAPAAESALDDGAEAAIEQGEGADAAAEEGDVADTGVPHQDGSEGAAEGEDGAEAPLEEEEFKRPAAELKAIVEALIFASPDPLTPKALLKLLDNEPKEDVLAALEDLTHDYDRPGGLQLVEVAGGYQIVTRPDLHEWVRRLFHERSTQKLSVQALETLAVIAYRQPITAIEITEIRGVNTSGVLNTLLERHLIKIVGRKQVVGRPFMYSTTKEFLIRFGLKDLGDLPKVEDMAESLGIESTLLVEQTPPEEQLPLSEPEADDVETMPAADDVTDPEE
jgi:segregation and condensation protein B